MDCDTGSNILIFSHLLTQFINLQFFVLALMFLSCLCVIRIISSLKMRKRISATREKKIIYRIDIEDSWHFFTWDYSLYVNWGTANWESDERFNNLRLRSSHEPTREFDSITFVLLLKEKSVITPLWTPHTVQQKVNTKTQDN